MTGAPSRLMLIVGEPISEWIAKGEVVDRYYNPGDVFDELHLVLVNDDDPPRDALARMAGRANWRVHQVPRPRWSFARSLGWRPALLRRWAHRLVSLAAEIRPDLVRCYGPGLNTFAAAAIKRELGVPYAVSVHINHDEDLRSRARTPRQWLATHAMQAVEREGLRGADLVLPVYEPIVPYLLRMGVTQERICVAYNMIDDTAEPKASYDLARPPRFVSVGRQFDAKDPRLLIRALTQVDDVELLLVGDGPLHNDAVRLAADLGVANRVRFERAISNDELCRALPTFDAFLTHSRYSELSKAVIEALLAALPVVVNRRAGAPVPELTDDIALLVDDSAEGFAHGMDLVLRNHELRARLGTAAGAYARRTWAREVTEAVLADSHRALAGLGRAP